MESMPLPAGTRAPAFQLHERKDRVHTLAEQRGHPVVLIFYPADFSPVCSDELAVFNELLPDLTKLGAHVFGISVDSVWSHRAFARERHLHYALLADFHPKGDVARAYNAWVEREGTAARALYVIDKNGVIFWSQAVPLDENPGAGGVLDALEQLAQRDAELHT